MRVLRTAPFSGGMEVRFHGMVPISVQCYDGNGTGVPRVLMHLLKRSIPESELYQRKKAGHSTSSISPVGVKTCFRWVKPALRPHLWYCYRVKDVSRFIHVLHVEYFGCIRVRMFQVTAFSRKDGGRVYIYALWQYFCFGQLAFSRRKLM
jgi:hypothetical protein